MVNLAVIAEAKNALFSDKLSTPAILGIVLGIVMPLVSAAIYPTYVHFMKHAGVEWTRLLELPFVACEIFIIHWAMRRGMNSAVMWQGLPKDIKIASIALLIGIFASSLFISAEPLRSITMSLSNVVHLLFAFAVFHLIRLSSSLDLSALILGLGAGLISLTAVTAWKFAFPPPLSQVPGGVIEWGSALPGFISVRHFGSWTGAITAAFLTILLYAHDRQRLSWHHFFFFLAAAMTIWSATRAAILALVLTAAILVLMHRKMPSLRTLSMLGFLTGLSLITAVLLPPYGDPTFMLYNTTDISSADAMASGRLVLWAATFDKWLDSILLGWGSGSIFWEVFVGWRHTQPHNALLQFLISWGLVGTLSALWLISRATIAAHKIASCRTELQPLLAMLYTLLIMSLLEGMLHYPRFIMLIMLCYAVILSRKTDDNDGSINPQPPAPPTP